MSAQTEQDARRNTKETKAAISSTIHSPGLVVRLQVFLFTLAVPLNLIWEVAQIGAYDFPETALMADILGCLVPSLGDGLMTLIIYWAGWIIFRNPFWILHPGSSGYLLMMTTGLLLAVFVEWNALFRTGAWTYNQQMIVIPVVAVGLLPALQMIVLPAAAALLLQRVWRRGGTGYKAGL